MPGKTLLLLGSGPGIGLSVASTFSVRGFTHIALVSRNKERLEQDWDAVLTAVQERGYTCQVKTWVCDLADAGALKKVLEEVKGFGSLECVFYNAARVGGKGPLEEEGAQIEEDFKVTNLALYQTAQWAIPLLKERAAAVDDASPSLIVTSTSQLYKEPIPELFSLSMVKSAQRALVLSLHATFGSEVHIALLSIEGVVSPDNKKTSPESIAEQAWQLYKQPKDKWTREMEVLDGY